MSYWSYKSYIIAAAILLLTLPFSAGALEVTFPSVEVPEEGTVEVTDSMGPAQWIRYIFLMAQALVGLAIIYALVRSGVEWMTARDNVGQVKTAKARIGGAVLGLIILLGSYIFLRTINPQLVEIRNPSVNTPSGSFGFGDFFGKLTGGTLGDACDPNLECRPGLSCINNVCSIQIETTSCNLENLCTTLGKRCLNTVTGELIGLNVAGEGICTNRRAIGENCAPVGMQNRCLVGQCIGNKCVLAAPPTE